MFFPLFFAELSVIESLCILTLSWFINELKQTSVVSQLKLECIIPLNESALSMLGKVVSLTELTIIDCIVNEAGMRIFISKNKPFRVNPGKQ